MVFDEHGRGMLIIEAVALDWGVDVTEHGKRIWLDLPCRAA